MIKEKQGYPVLRNCYLLNNKKPEEHFALFVCMLLLGIHFNILDLFINDD